MSDSPLVESAPSPAADAGWWSPRRFALVLAVLIFIQFWNVLLGTDTFAVRDFGLFSYPVAFFQRQCFWKGELPWWNPLSCCGLPFLAQLNTLALYPPALIYLLLPLSWSLPFFCLLHVFFGGMGMYFLAVRWTGSRAGGVLAGVVFAFNGLSLNFLMWPSHIATFAWIPWVILLTEAGWRQGGRKLVLAALAAALQVLAGGPESILFTWLILLAVALVLVFQRLAPLKDLARRFCLVGILALCLAAMQLLPFADFALHSNRDTHYAASEWAMPPWGWGNFLVPVFQTYQWQGMAVQFNQYWTSSYYVGIGVLLLAALAVWRARNWRVWLLGGFVVASMVLALGDGGFVYLWLRKAVPFLGLFRFPIKFVILTSALMPLLAAFALGQYKKKSGGEWSLRAEWFVGLVLTALMGLILWLAVNHPAPGSLWQFTLKNALVRLLVLAAFLVVIRWFATRPAQRHWSVLLLAGICWLDLITAMPWQNPTLDASVYQPGLGEMIDKFNPEPDIAQSRLMISPFSARHIYYEPAKDLKTTYLLDRSVFLSDCNLLDNFPKVDGFFSLYLRESSKVLWLLDSRSGADLDRLEDFLGVSQTVAPGKIFDWIARTNYLPIVSIGQQPIFADDSAAFRAIVDTNVDFRRVVFLPLEAKALVTAKSEPSARVIHTEFGDNKESIQVETPRPAMVYISQAYYHNWKAEVDGKPVPIWRANSAFQAVEIPAGTHELRLKYRDKMFLIGAVLMAWAGLICLALWNQPVAPD